MFRPHSQGVRLEDRSVDLRVPSFSCFPANEWYLATDTETEGVMGAIQLRVAAGRFGSADEVDVLV